MNINLKVAITVDNLLLSELLSTQLERSGFTVSYRTKSSNELIEYLETNTHILPDICILGIRLKSNNGYLTLRDIKRRWPFIRVLIISDYNHELVLKEIIQLGAGGFLFKNNTSFDEVVTAIRQIYFNGFYFSKNLTVEQYQRIRGKVDFIITSIPKRELEFLNMLVNDMTYEEIAQGMNVSKHTVETYRNNLFHRFNVHTKSELLSIIYRLGLI